MKVFPLVRSPRAAAVGALSVIVPFLLLSGSALGGLYASVLWLIVGPAAICVVAAVCGALSAALGAAAAVAALARPFGGTGAALAAMYGLPIAAAFAVLVMRREPFRRACLVMIGVHLAAMAACFMMLQNLAGGSLYAEAGRRAAQAVEQWSLGDTLLYQLYSMGLLDLPAAMEGAALRPVLGGYELAAEAKKDLLLSLQSLVSTQLFALIPSVIVTQSILGGVACLILPLRFGAIAQERRALKASSPEGEGAGAAEAFPDLGMPGLETWHLPRGVGWKVGAALVAGYFLQGSAQPSLCVAGVILYAAARAIYSIQGAALVYYMQKARGIKRVWRVIVPIALLLFSILFVIGVFDQISNIRRLRKPREPKEGL